MTALDPRDADRFCKLLGLLSSDHDGERAAAALKATEFLRAREMGWPDVAEMLKRPALPVPTRQGEGDHRDRAHRLLMLGYPWNAWSLKFLRSIVAWNNALSPKQCQTLWAMEEEASARTGGAR